MKPEDKQAFGELITDALAFYRRDVSKFALSVWWQACQRFSLEQVTKALTAHAMDPEQGRFPPMPGDIVRQLQGTHQDRSLIAWGRVMEAMRAVGAYRSVDFGDAAIHQAITDMGGWQKLCRSTTDELPFVQKRFCEAHRTYATRGEPADAPRLLAGEFDQTNAAAGHASAEPVRLGPKLVRKALSGDTAA